MEAKIRKLKHAINIFNATQTVDGFDMTIDELLVYIPQLTKRKSKLLEMKSRLPKGVWRTVQAPVSIIDYTTPTMTSRRWRPTMKAADGIVPCPACAGRGESAETFEV